MLTITTPAQTAFDDLSKELEQLDRDRVSLEQSALAGNIDGASLARFDADRSLVVARLNAARRALEKEQSGRSPEKDIRAAIDGLLKDPALSTDDVAAAVNGLQAALEQVVLAVDARNTALRGWVTKLHTAGVPREGLEIDGVPITVRGTGVGDWAGSEITYGGNRIAAIPTAAPYVKGITDPITKGHDFTSTVDNLAQYDKRDQQLEPEMRVRLVKDAGGNKTGDILTTHKQNASVLRHLMTGGFAIEVDQDGAYIPS